MNARYIPTSLVEHYERASQIARRKRRNMRLLVALYFLGMLAIDVYLLWPVKS